MLVKAAYTGLTALVIGGKTLPKHMNSTISDEPFGGVNVILVGDFH